ncbi:hypothetical protein [Micromonospora sp. KC606]|uniref:hypothetical protein n=1 Tax=Micromonospora sp. KC606 TaxID=2530379 RepID=UPI001A9F4748|nr:hypothetical protein [Micromonospora sp. KC606]
MVSAESAGTAYVDRPSAARTALVRTCAHDFSHGAWLAEGELIRDAGRSAGIPGVLIHGRLDLGSPLTTAWEPHRAWPGSELVVVEGVGHLGTRETRRHLRQACDRFAG